MGERTNLVRWAAEGDPNTEVLTTLAEAGSDLSKPHCVEFFLLFNDEHLGAEKLFPIAAILESDGFEAAFSFVDSNDNYCTWVVAKTSLIPTLEAVKKIGDQLKVLAKHFGGIYDGWETTPVLSSP